MTREIVWLKSMATGKEFPTVMDNADTDMDWDGYAPLTSNSVNEIVMCMVRPEEMNDCALLQTRANKELNRSDLMRTDISRVVKCEIQPGEGFQEYVKRAKSFAEEYYYTDIFSEKNEAILIRKESISDFMGNGGLITYHPNK